MISDGVREIHSYDMHDVTTDARLNNTTPLTPLDNNDTLE